MKSYYLRIMVEQLIAQIRQMQDTIDTQRARIAELEARLGYAAPAPALETIPDNKQKIIKKYPNLLFGQGEITKAQFVTACYISVYGYNPGRGKTDQLFSSFYQDVSPAAPNAKIKGTKIIGISLRPQSNMSS